MVKINQTSEQADMETTAASDNYNPALVQAANYGIQVGLPEDQIVADIQAATPAGWQSFSKNEISIAIKQARWEICQHPLGDAHRVSQYLVRRPRLNAIALRNRIMEDGSPNEEDLLEASPVSLHEAAGDQADFLLVRLYRPDDLLCLGGFGSNEVKTSIEWSRYIMQHGTVNLPFIFPNLLDVYETERMEGKIWRPHSDAVSGFRFAVVKFTNLSRYDQLRFWSGITRRKLLDVACLVDDGVGNIEAWLFTNQASPLRWEHKVGQKLFDNWLIPLGADPACRDASYQACLPGYKNSTSGKYQRLLWFGFLGER